MTIAQNTSTNITNENIKRSLLQSFTTAVPNALQEIHSCDMCVFKNV